jgi:hypothetical protein
MAYTQVYTVTFQFMINSKKKFEIRITQTEIRKILKMKIFFFFFLGYFLDFADFRLDLGYVI